MSTPALNVNQTLVERFNCDAVETFKHPDGRTLVACGMYELNESTQKRIGDISLYRYDAEPKSLTLLKKRDEDMAGIFDMKWLKHAPYIIAACADGNVSQLNDELKTCHIWPICPDSGFCLAVDYCRNRPNTSLVTTTNGDLHMLDMETGVVSRVWEAHSYIHDKSPAEIWTVACGKQSSVVNLCATGADDGFLKLWDCRDQSSAKPVVSRREAHNGDGVCAVQFSFVDDHVLFSGGYDGHLKEWDVRNLNIPVQATSSRQGGGVWRVKEDVHGRLLAACMRGGFRVLDRKCALQEIAKYTEAADDHWEALAYGIDWIDDSTFAGCSFYDKTLRIMTIG